MSDGMEFAPRFWAGARVAVFAACASLSICSRASADGWSPESIGVRYAVSATSIDDFYWQLEPDLRWRLPWELELGRNWQMHWKVSATTGWLAARGDHGFVGTLGPLVTMEKQDWPVWFEGGLSPTYLSRQKYDDDDFGSHVQFTTHAGVMWRLGERWSLGYRFQHMSNGGFCEPNPGLNMHAFQCFWRF